MKDALSPPAAPFTQAFLSKLPHGLAAGVHLPPRLGTPLEEALSRLHPQEREIVDRARGWRQVQLAGGRLAFGTLLAELGLERIAVRSDLHGAPILPPGWAGSLSHTRNLAVAIMAPGEHGLGIDVEETRRARPGIAQRVLCPDEVAALSSPGEEARALQILIHFSIKEALYKAVHPLLRRPLNFRDFALQATGPGAVTVEARLPEAGRLELAAWYLLLDDHVLATAVARAR
ncbi:MAG: 4'-phosphopantetheinyl transferase superfamily protein [Acidobacteriota bacterium]